jgi:hypothetical protein
MDRVAQRNGGVGQIDGTIRQAVDREDGQR